MYSWDEDQTAEGMPITIWYREMLANADNFDQALAFAQRPITRTIAVNTLLADGNKAAILETSSTKIATRYPVDGVVYAANHFESKTFIGDYEPDRDYRWPALSKWSNIDRLMNFEDVRSVIAESAMEDEDWTNVLAFFVDYESKQVVWGSRHNPAANGELNYINLNTLF